jgi:hypothetical protein
MSGCIVEKYQDNAAVKRSEIIIIFCGLFIRYQNDKNKESHFNSSA